MPSSSITFSVDADDRLIAMNDEWTNFAVANDGAALTPDRMVGQVLWTQIADEPTRAIYRLILERVREGHPVTFRYRCDSPRHRRTFLMAVKVAEARRVDFTSTLLTEETRPPVALLERNQARDDRHVPICSWCQNVDVGNNTWVSVEEAVNTLLVESAFPVLTHGICPPCAEQLVSTIAAS
ncbi:MAG: hypothetical protein ABIZ04_09220 [Opitutus sp.]